MSPLNKKFELLSADDIELVAKLSERIHYSNSNEPFLNHLFVVLNDALPRMIFSIDSYSVNPVFFEQATSEGISKELYSLYQTYMHQHPLVNLLLQPGGGIGTILTETSADEFHKTDLYRKFYKKLGVEDQLAFALPHPSGVYVVVYSRDMAFSEKEQIIMQLLKPQLHIALKNWQQIRELEQHLRTLEEKSSVSVQEAREARVLIDRLSPRQRAVAEQVAQGFENRQIAEILHISPKTVGKHLENIFEILNIHNRVALAALWRQSVQY